MKILDSREKKLTALVVLGLVVMSLTADLNDINRPYETWDDATTYSLGLNFLYNIAQLDFSPVTWNAYSENYTGSFHPPFGRYLYGVVNGICILSQTGPSLFHMDKEQSINTLYVMKNYIPGKLLAAAFSVGTLVLLFFISKRYFGLKTAVMASVIFALLPATLAQMRTPALEPPLLFFYTLSIFLFLKGLEKREYLWLSLIVTGLAFAIKYNAATLFLLLPAIYLLYNGKPAFSKKHLILIPIVTLMVLLLVWPRLWSDPLGSFSANLLAWKGVTGTTGVVPEYFLGGYEHPVYYEALYILATTPLLILAFLVIGAVAALKSVLARRISAREGMAASDSCFGRCVFILWAVVPLVMYAFFNFKMGGPRYIFMIYPALAVLAAAGMFSFSDWLKKGTPRFGKAITYGLPAVTAIYLIATAALIHPYYLDYYNEALGGAKNVYDNNLFAIGTRGEGIGEAAFWVYANAEQNASVQFFVMPRHVIPWMELNRPDMKDPTPFKPKYLSSTGDNENWDMTNVTPQADYMVENTYFRLYMNESFHEDMTASYRLVHAIEAQGAPLAWIYKKN